MKFESRLTYFDQTFPVFIFIEIEEDQMLFRIEDEYGRDLTDLVCGQIGVNYERKEVKKEKVEG